MGRIGLLVLAARVLSAFNDVLVTLYILWFIEPFSTTFIAPLLICVSKSGLTVGGVVEYGLPRFAVGTRDDKVPLKGFAVGY